MARRAKSTRGRRPRKAKSTTVEDYRHEEARRKNNPPAKIAAEGTVPAIPKARYSYSPRRPPRLQFDPAGSPDKLPELLAAARRRPLTDEEARELADALQQHQPWLEWADKREQHQRGGFDVDPVALHIHERISAQAILKVAARQDVQRHLFADPELEYHEAVQFYRHDIDWANRLILGDSLQVMSSLARREDLAGKVQMIYIDPPYGIKFASNFQPEIGNRDVKDREENLTREPEMVKAYRDTWRLGVHSYLSYLRERLVSAKELLADTGSIFVQIGDENAHLVRGVLDELFGRNNFMSQISFRTKIPLNNKYLANITDSLLWYARDVSCVKYHRIFVPRKVDDDSVFGALEMPAGERVRLSDDERATAIASGARPFSLGDLKASGYTETCHFEFYLEGRRAYPPGSNSWKTNPDGMRRLLGAGRVVWQKTTPRMLGYAHDYPVIEVTNQWADTQGAVGKSFVVQTAEKVLRRCMLMTTDPGNLVLDPTCGSGTTAYVAEQWGRRWITIDTSRVAIAIARQRLLTARFDRYRVNGEDESGNGNGNFRPGVDPHPGFVNKTVPHITLGSIARNTNLDPIFAKHEPILDEKLAAANAALQRVTDQQRTALLAKLVGKQRQEGKKAVTEADRRRWELPRPSMKWGHWQVPFDTDQDWPRELREAVQAYREAWRAKMDEINECIAANAEQEELVDQPEVIRSVVRVSGPFTVEAVQPPELSLGDNIDAQTGEEGLFDGEPPELPEGFEPRELRIVEPRPDMDTQNVEAYLDQMLRYLKVDGVRFPNNKQTRFTRLERLSAAEPGLHAEGRWVLEGQDDPDPEGKATVCVAFGPQYGPVTAKMVEGVVRSANRMGYDDLVIAGFSFDGPAQTVIEEVQVLRIHAAHIRPDVNPGMNGLLKEQPGSQLFTVFGQPRTRVDGPDRDGNYTVTMEGVDIYNPVDNSILPTEAEKVAAWFIDGDYDGRTFCVTQAFFPDRTAWDKLAKALKGVVDPDAFAAFSGTTSLPFPAGKHKHVAVKVIDPRGNEVMRVHELR